MANSIINTYNRSILNGNPIYLDCFAPFQLKSWLYLKDIFYLERNGLI
jgi:hypothetical protein